MAPYGREVLQRLSEDGQRIVPIIALHERLGIDIPEADYPKLATTDGAVAYLNARTGTGSAG